MGSNSVKQLSFKSNIFNLVKFFIDCGTYPDILLLFILIMRRLVRLPMVDGILLFNWYMINL